MTNFKWVATATPALYAKVPKKGYAYKSTPDGKVRIVKIPKKAALYAQAPTAATAASIAALSNQAAVPMVTLADQSGNVLLTPAGNSRKRRNVVQDTPLPTPVGLPQLVQQTPQQPALPPGTQAAFEDQMGL